MTTPIWLDEKAAGTESTPARVLGTPFAPNAIKPTLCVYSVQSVCAHGNDGNVQLLCDASNPPTTKVGEFRASLTDDAASMTLSGQLIYLCPPGHFVELVAAGTGTLSIISQAEIAMF